MKGERKVMKEKEKGKVRCLIREELCLGRRVLLPWSNRVEQASE